MVVKADGTIYNFSNPSLHCFIVSELIRAKVPIYTWEQWKQMYLKILDNYPANVETEFHSDIEELKPLWTTQAEQSRLVYLGRIDGVDSYGVAQLDGSMWRFTEDRVRKYVIGKMFEAGVKVISQDAWKEHFDRVMGVQKLPRQSDSDG